jgi:hypothetical protein
MLEPDVGVVNMLGEDRHKGWQCLGVMGEELGGRMPRSQRAPPTAYRTSGEPECT